MRPNVSTRTTALLYVLTRMFFEGRAAMSSRGDVRARRCVSLARHIREQSRPCDMHGARVDLFPISKLGVMRACVARSARMMHASGAARARTALAPHGRTSTTRRFDGGSLAAERACEAATKWALTGSRRSRELDARHVRQEHCGMTVAAASCVLRTCDALAYFTT